MWCAVTRAEAQRTVVKNESTMVRHAPHVRPLGHDDELEVFTVGLIECTGSPQEHGAHWKEHWVGEDSTDSVKSGRVAVAADNIHVELVQERFASLAQIRSHAFFLALCTMATVYVEDPQDWRATEKKRANNESRRSPRLGNFGLGFKCKVDPTVIECLVEEDRNVLLLVDVVLRRHARDAVTRFLRNHDANDTAHCGYAGCFHFPWKARVPFAHGETELVVHEVTDHTRKRLVEFLLGSAKRVHRACLRKVPRTG